MVYCSKCGTLNPDDATNCSKCGAPLTATHAEEPWTGRRYHYHDYYHRGSIWGVLVGLFILAIGVSTLFGWDFWSLLWPAFLIFVGLAIIIGTASRGRW